MINAATYEGIRDREGIIIQDLGLRSIKGRTKTVHVYGVQASTQSTALQ